jgi:hypothetical protein
MLTSMLQQTVSLRTLLSSRALGAISVAGMVFTTIPPSSIVGAMLWAGYLGHIVVAHLNMMQA